MLSLFASSPVGRPIGALLYLCLIGLSLLGTLLLSPAAAAQSPSSVVTTTYTYNEVNLLPSATTVTTSDGLARRTVTTYAHETQGGMGPTGTHQLTDVYETRVYGGTVFSGGSPLFETDPTACTRTSFTSSLTSGPGFVPHRLYAGCGDDETQQAHLRRYDAFGRPDSLWQAGGLVTSVAYTGRHVAGITRYAGDVVLTQSFDYDAFGRLAAEVDENGTTLHYAYDGLGRLTQVARSAPGGTPEILAEHEYYLSVVANGGYDAGQPNYVRTWLHAGSGAPDETTAFLDGLGREIQTQQRIGASDVAVAFPEYDALGRPHREWRAVGMPRSAGAPNDHGFIPIDIVRSEALAEYQDAPGGGTGADNRPYAETTYEPNPLSRPEEEQAPGAGTDAGGSGASLTYVYGVASPQWNAQDEAPPMAFTEARDEDDRWTRTYTDGLGRERFVARGQGTTTETLTGMVYDAADRLRHVRPPHYFDPPAESSSSDWITRYSYDTRGLLISKTTPDTRNADESGPGQHRHAYDRSGRLRYSQDPEQRARGEVAFTRYDQMGRPTESGVGRPLVCDEKTNGPTAPEDCWDDLAAYARDGGDHFPDAHYGEGAHFEWAGSNRRMQFHYDDPAETNTNQQVLVERWPFNGDPAFEYTNPLGRPVAVAYRTDGLWSSGASTWQSTFFAYDAAGNVAERWVRTEGAPHAWARFGYTYDRQGRVRMDSVRVGPYRLLHTYQYDRRGLMTTVRASATDDDHGGGGGGGPILLPPDLALTYAVDGTVTERELGYGAATVSYTYDVAGRLHAINDPEASGAPFAARYAYSPGGLIEAMEVRSDPHAVQACSSSGIHADACTPRWRYDFTYDRLARLIGARHGHHTGDTYQDTNFFRLRGLAYDRQGNITTLKRQGATGTGSPGVDDLAYHYQPGTNRLVEVTDQIQPEWSWDAKPTTFEHDRNGSMTRMVELLPGNQTRTTTVHRYDERHLPERLRIAETGERTLMVEYAYDANGQRIRKHAFGSLLDMPVGGDPDPRFTTEHYLREGMQVIGTFDGDGNLLWWNLGGAAGLVGRIEPETTTELDEALALQTAEDALTEHTMANLLFALAPTKDGPLSPAEAQAVADDAYDDVLQVAHDAVPDAVDAAMEQSMDVDPVGSTHYGLTADATVNVLWTTLQNHKHDPSLARTAGPATASASAQLVAAAVTNAYVERPVVVVPRLGGFAGAETRRPRHPLAALNRRRIVGARQRGSEARPARSPCRRVQWIQAVLQRAAGRPGRSGSDAELTAPCPAERTHHTSAGGGASSRAR